MEVTALEVDDNGDIYVEIDAVASRHDVVLGLLSTILEDDRGNRYEHVAARENRNLEVDGQGAPGGDTDQKPQTKPDDRHRPPATARGPTRAPVPELTVTRRPPSSPARLAP